MAPKSPKEEIESNQGQAPRPRPINEVCRFVPDCDPWEGNRTGVTGSYVLEPIPDRDLVLEIATVKPK